MKILVTILSIFWITNVSSQSEFAPIGAEWIMNDWYCLDELEEPLESITKFQSEKDTTINNLNFRKVNTWLFHQDNYKVYYLWEDTLRLIYDFELAVGDTVKFDMLTCKSTISKITFEVTKVDSIEFRNENLKRIECNLVEGYLPFDSYTYIERIGSTRKIVEDLADCLLVPGAVPEQLRCYHEQGSVYITDWFSQFGYSDCEILTNIEEHLESNNSLNISPNPVHDYINIKSQTSDIKNANIYSTNGQFMGKHKIQNHTSLDLKNLNSGSYFIIAYDKDMNIIGSSKFIKS